MKGSQKFSVISALGMAVIVGLAFQNCGDVQLKNLPSEAGSASATSYELLTLDDYTPTPTDYTDPAQNTDAGSWQNAVKGGATVIEGRAILRTEQQGCKVYNKSEIPYWNPYRGATSITSSAPLIVQDPYSTLSIRFTKEELLDPAIDGNLQLYYDQKALISVTTRPCQFISFSDLQENPSFCQRSNGVILMRQSTPELLAAFANGTASSYGYACILPDSEEYFINVTWIAPQDIGKPGAVSTCQLQWCYYDFLLQ